MKNIKELLKKPGRESQPWAIWIWNLTISPGQMVRQLEWFAQNGFGGVAIRPSRNMAPGYLSEEFLELFGTVLQLAQQYGIGIRIAEDLSLPWSGCFAQDLIHSRRMRAQQMRLLEKRAVLEGEEVFLPEDRCGEEIILTVRIQNGSIDPSSVHAIGESGASQPDRWRAPGSEWKLLRFRKEYIEDPAYGYVPNIFNPKTASLYLQQVLELFRTRFSKFIPSTFEGFISELPSCRPGDNSIPWDDDLVVKYRSKSKKNMIRLLPALFCDNFPSAQKSRQQIYSFIFQSMYERFAVPLEAWSKKNRLSQWVLAPERSIHLTKTVLVDGYVPQEKDLNIVGYQNIDGVSENYALLRIMADTNANEHRRETVTVLGRNRSGIGATLQSLKSDMDTLLLSGSSRIIIDGCFFNPDHRSYGKTPFNISWYSPGNANMAKLCAYSARSQELLKNVHWTRQVAVLTPTSEIMAAYQPGGGTVLPAEGFERTQKTVQALERSCISYDMVSESLLSSFSVRNNGEFGTADRIRRGNYRALVIPYAPDISRNALIFIEKLVQKDGCVLFVGEAPRGTIEDGVSPTMASRIEKIVASRHKGVGIVPLDALEETFSSLGPYVKISVNGRAGSDIYHAFGSVDGCELYYFHNTSDIKEQMASITLPESKHFTKIDCETGEFQEIEPEERSNGSCVFQLCAHPKATLFFVGSAGPLVSHGSPEKQSGRVRFNPFSISERSYRIVLKDQWTFSTSSLNALPLANWNVRIGLSRESGGFSHFYETHFQVKSLPTICKLMLSMPCPVRKNGADVPIEVTVNGTKVDPVGSRSDEVLPEQIGEPVVSEMKRFDETNISVLGESFLAFPIRDCLVHGFNRISLRTTGQVLDPGTIHYPPLIFGDFTLVKGQNGWAIDMLSDTVGQNSWIKHGFPYLCGKGIYSQSFEIPNEYKQLILRFSQVSGTIDVTLNGKDLGIFNWHPMEIDITQVCEPKRNELVVGVVNSFDTLLRMNGSPSGLVGEVYLDVY